MAPPLPLPYAALVLPEEPAGHEATAHQQSARAKREQRGSAGTTGLRKLGHSRSRGRSRGRRSLRRRRRSRSSLRRRGRRGRSARGLGHNSSGLRRYYPILTLGLGLRATSLGLLGLGVGYDRRLVLSQGGRSGQQGHRQHRRQYHQLPQSNLPPLARKFVSIGGGPFV